VSLIERKLSFGKLRVIVFDFKETGDKLDWHTHGERDVHMTIVVLGSLLSEWENDQGKIESMIISPPMMIDWNVGVRHAFTALEPSRLVNIIKDPIL
jgi:hypothetical protein